MNKSTLIDAVAEAKRFVSAAEAALAADTAARAACQHQADVA